MSEYIKKENLYQYLDNEFEWSNNQDRLGVLEAVTDFETADAEPVKHGKWLTDTQEVDSCIKCSVCGIELDKFILNGKMPEYCLCGAKMDLE